MHVNTPHSIHSVHFSNGYSVIVAAVFLSVPLDCRRMWNNLPYTFFSCLCFCCFFFLTSKPTYCLTSFSINWLHCIGYWWKWKWIWVSICVSFGWLYEVYELPSTVNWINDDDTWKQTNQIHLYSQVKPIKPKPNEYIHTLTEWTTNLWNEQCKSEHVE